VKLSWLIQQVYYEPSLITPEAHASIRRMLESRLGDELVSALGDSPEAKQRTATVCGEKIDLPSMQVLDGIAHIPVGGAIGQKLGNWARYAGAVDVQEIWDDIDEAEADKKVRSILFDVDSPGGMVSGTPELAARVAEIKKPKVTFSNGMIASAAYWFAAATDGIYTTLTANSGSIGVLLPFVDQAERYKQAGVKVEIIKAGSLKGMGFPGTSLTDEQRAHLQQRVDQIYSMFAGHVREHRGNIDEDSMQGQTFMAEEAFARGLIDGVVKNKDEVCEMLLSR
jgi:signal peptide peptidase SppA